jgi:hypothetical protein
LHDLKHTLRMLGQLEATRIKKVGGESKVFEGEVCHFCANGPSGEKLMLELSGSLATNFRQRQGCHGQGHCPYLAFGLGVIGCLERSIAKAMLGD